MSEYQYYEFRKIDSSLSDRAMEEISALSSRAHVSRNSASFTYLEASVAAPLASPASTGVLFAKARRMQSDRKRKANEREAALKLLRLEALERDEESLWRRVDELIAGKTVKTYDEAIGILKDLSDLALHKERREEFMRRVQTILGKYPRLSGLQSRIKNAKLFEGLESK